MRYTCELTPGGGKAASNWEGVGADLVLGVLDGGAIRGGTLFVRGGLTLNGLVGGEWYICELKTGRKLRRIVPAGSGLDAGASSRNGTIWKGCTCGHWADT